MWPKAWGPSKVLFMLGRYTPLVLLVLGAATTMFPTDDRFPEKVGGQFSKIYPGIADQHNLGVCWSLDIVE